MTNIYTRLPLKGIVFTEQGPIQALLELTQELALFVPPDYQGLYKRHMCEEGISRIRQWHDILILDNCEADPALLLSLSWQRSKQFPYLPQAEIAQVQCVFLDMLIYHLVKDKVRFLGHTIESIHLPDLYPLESGD